MKTKKPGPGLFVFENGLAEFCPERRQALMLCGLLRGPICISRRIATSRRIDTIQCVAERENQCDAGHQDRGGNALDTLH